jgi:hypothetical protein
MVDLLTPVPPHYIRRIEALEMELAEARRLLWFAVGNLPFGQDQPILQFLAPSQPPSTDSGVKNPTAVSNSTDQRRA